MKNKQKVKYTPEEENQGRLAREILMAIGKESSEAIPDETHVPDKLLPPM